MSKHPWNCATDEKLPPTSRFISQDTTGFNRYFELYDPLSNPRDVLTVSKMVAVGNKQNAQMGKETGKFFRDQCAEIPEDWAPYRIVFPTWQLFFFWVACFEWKQGWRRRWRWQFSPWGPRTRIVIER